MGTQYLKLVHCYICTTLGVQARIVSYDEFYYYYYGYYYYLGYENIPGVIIYQSARIITMQDLLSWLPGVLKETFNTL